MCSLEISVGIKLVQNGFIFYLKILYSTLMTYIFYKMEGLVIKLGGGRGGGGGRCHRISQIGGQACGKFFVKIGVSPLPTIRNLSTLSAYFINKLTWKKPGKHRYWQNFT